MEKLLSGEVSKNHIDQLQCAREGRNYSRIEVLPFVDNPLKHINPKKQIFHSSNVKSDGGFIYQPFIDRDSLVYLSKADEGIEFLKTVWGNPGVKFEYKQIHHAIKGFVSCIQNHHSRCSPQDPGLVFKYFPYEKYENLEINAFKPSD